MNIAVLTVSDTRTAAEDVSGDTLVSLVQAAGHTLASRTLLRDDAAAIVEQLRAWIDDDSIDVVLSTGGTGITGRDVTPEAFRAVLTKEIPGFGELFRMQSFAKIGLAAMQSRALGGVAGRTLLFALPGSPSAVADAWNGILKAELELSGNCTLATLMPRLGE